MPSDVTAVSTLRAVPFFSSLREGDLERLASLFRPREYVRNRVILFAHDPCDAFYIVITGQVKVMLIAEDGREVILSLVREGDFFGEMSLMDDEPYSSSAIAMEDSRLLVLHRDDFRRSIEDMPGMSFGLLRALCGRLREADHRIGGLMLLDVAGRIAHLFLDLASRSGGDCINDPPTHQIIAQMVGSSRETVSRTVSTLAAQGLIETSKDGLKIVNRQGLENTAGQMLQRRLKTPPAARQIRRSEPGVRGPLQP
ncbi:MAG TPA: Crp/Fnr family transcriptional regulator [Gemmatimonadaceae bacterium]|jgi:CRP-like cAMP-binding protein